MEINDKNITNIIGLITGVLGFVGIMVTYALNSIKDRNMEFFKTKQKYYNVFLESFIVKLSEMELIKIIENDIKNSDLQLIKLEENMKILEKELKKDSKFLPGEIKDKIDNLKNQILKLGKKNILMKETKRNRELILLEVNKKFSIEASRLPLYASEEVIKYIEEVKNPKFNKPLKEFYQLMRNDLISGKVKKIKDINFTGSLYH